MECTGQGNDFRLILMVKMKTRRPIGAHLQGGHSHGKVRELQSGQGKLLKSGKTIVSFCRPARANTLNNEIVLALFAFLIWQYHNYTSSLAVIINVFLVL